MMTLNDLTPEEIELVQQRRKEKAQHEAACVFQRKAIATANAFAEWSSTEGGGLELGYSTFVNTFGYQDMDGNQMYEAVKRIHDAAWPKG